jgi:hypothetical protein
MLEATTNHFTASITRPGYISYNKLFWRDLSKKELLKLTNNKMEGSIEMNFCKILNKIGE